MRMGTQTKRQNKKLKKKRKAPPPPPPQAVMEAVHVLCEAGGQRYSLRDAGTPGGRGSAGPVRVSTGCHSGPGVWLWWTGWWTRRQGTLWWPEMWPEVVVTFWPTVPYTSWPVFFFLCLVKSCCSFAKLCPTLGDPMDCRMPGFPVLHYLLEFAQTHVYWVGDHPTIPSSVTPFSSCLQSFPASGSFSSELALHIRWPKNWSFSFSIGPSNEYSGLISFRIDWFDLLAVPGTLRSLLQHNSKAPILGRSAFLMVQLSYLYMTTGKTIPLTIWIFVGKVKSTRFY